MWPFRHRKHTANAHLAFQGAAEDWLRRPRDADPDMAVLQAVHSQIEVVLEDDAQLEGIKNDVDAILADAKCGPVSAVVSRVIPLT